MGEPTRWVPLHDVAWQSAPVVYLQRSRASLESRFGAPRLVDLDSNGIGLFDAWLLRFDCGLEVALWWFHQHPNWRHARPEDTTFVPVLSNETELGHILFHLGEERASVETYESNIGVDGPACWQVRRLDDNGNEFEVACVTSRCQAEAMALAFEARGHKQSYWAQALDTRSPIC